MYLNKLTARMNVEAVSCEKKITGYKIYLKFI